MAHRVTVGEESRQDSDTRNLTPAQLAADPALTNTYVPADQIVSAVFGDGTTDATAHIQAKINATPAGGTLFIPRGTYRLTSALTIATHINILGGGIVPLSQPNTTVVNFNYPTLSPYLAGTVLRQDTAATDGIKITGSSISVSIERLGITFGAAIRHVNTGHGINAVPTQTDGSGHDTGVVNFGWRNIVVHGHDGNHYAYRLVNPLGGTLERLYAWGGGGFYFECDSFRGNYGNLVLSDTFAAVYVNGTAHGMSLKGRATGSSGVLNMLTMIRPQVNGETLSASIYPETFSAPTTAQYLYTHNGGTGLDHIAVFGPDFESWAIGMPTDFTTTARVWIDPTGILGGTNGLGSTTQPFIKPMYGSGNKRQYQDLTYHGANATNPLTMTAGANAGTSPPSPVAGTQASDEKGTLTFGTGTSPAAGVLARVAYSSFQGSNPIAIVLTAQNAATAALSLYVTQDSTGFNVCAVNAPSASQANTVYAVAYHAMQ